MTDRYFDKFPQITYSNNSAVDITRRVALLDKVSRNPYIFYPFEITGQERPDQLSNRYYEDPYKSWLIYLTNKITDPYYGWYLSEDEMQEFVNSKYGSLYSAQTKIKFYRNDWENKDPINKNEYNALIPELKKYWQPNYGVGNTVIDYVRKEADWSVSTNKIISYSVSNTAFIKNEICNIRLMDDSLGKGQVLSTTSNTVLLQHVYGSYFTSETVQIDPESHISYIYGTESNCNAVITAVTSLSNNISEEEMVYWKPITYYDYENEKNEYNKSIRLIDSSQTTKAVENLRTLLEVD